MEGLRDGKDLATGVLCGLMPGLVLLCLMTDELKKGANCECSNFSHLFEKTLSSFG